MGHRSNEHIRKALIMAWMLTVLADEGYASMEDDGCGVLFGVVLDCAHKIMAEAEREREAHKTRGIWNESNIFGKD